MFRLFARLGALSGLTLALILPLAACGRDGDGPAYAGSQRGGGGSRGASESGPYVGQEIWLTYDSPPHSGIGIRVKRSREEARALAEDLRAKVLAGADVGVLAQVHSNAPGARADGFSGVLPRDPEHLDDRDHALLRVREGDVTDLVDWNGGWWFARRIALVAGKRLETIFKALEAAGREATKTRVRARGITLLYVAAYPYRFEATDTLDQAKEKARKVLDYIKAGNDFAVVAKEGVPGLPLSGSWDDSGNRGGVLLAFDEAGKGDRWISRFDSGYPEALLKVLFEAPLGLVPEPIVTARGVMIAEIQERRRLK